MSLSFMVRAILLGLISSKCAVAVASAKDQTRLISNEGVGPIRAGTKVTTEEIQSLFPGMTVEKELVYSEDQPSGLAINVMRGKTIILQVISAGKNSDELFSVVVKDKEFRTADGQAVGQPLAQLLKKFKKRKCKRGVEETQDRIHCYLPGSHIVFDFPIDHVHEGNVPAQEEVAVSNARNRRIEAIFWKPKAL